MKRRRGPSSVVLGSATIAVTRPSQYDLDHAWPTFAYIIVAVAGLARQSAEGARAAAATDMTVWFLNDDRSRFEEGSLNHGENSHPDPAAALHG